MMDSEEFKRRFVPYYAQVYATAYRLCGNAQDAEDMMQMLYYHLWQKRHFLPQEASTAGYLCASIKNMYVSMLRKRGSVVTLALDEARLTESDIADDDTEQHRQLDKLSRAVEQLPDIERRVVKMHVYQGLGYKEIEHITGWRQGNIRMAMTRARLHLRNELKNKKYYD